MTAPAVGFDVHSVDVEPGGHRIYNSAEWGDAVVVVAAGEIELECLGGARRRFRDGDLLWLADLPLRALHNHGQDRALLLAFSRSYPGAPADS